MEKVIGAQLYTIRDYCKDLESFEKAMKKVKEIGYSHVQISGIDVEDEHEIKRVCDENGLAISCTHRSFANFKDNLEYEIERHKVLGSPCAGVGGIAKELRADEKTFLETIETLNKISDELAKHGITFTYHNHEWEFMKMENGKSYMDYYIEYGRFSFILDVYWAAFAGINPAKLIKRLGKRAICVHFKDLQVQPSRAIAYSEVGKGNLDWDEIIEACDEAGVKWALVEQDTCQTDSLGCLETSYKFLTTKGFK